ncbi:MAG: DUF5677 domain-containing protein [Candidatus Paceibacterota bacterium]|jgi:hypothetical protein
MFNPINKKKFAEIKSILIDHLNQLEGNKSLIPVDIFDVTKFSIDEFVSIFESMETLMRMKDFEGCLKLSRSILENSINLQYIYKEDTEKRAENFKLTQVKGMTKKFEVLDEFTPEAKEMYDLFKEKLKDYKEIKIREKFKVINSEIQYLKSYQRLSEFTHPTYRSKKIDFTERRPFVENLKRIVRSDTCLITLMALEVVCIKYDLDGGIMMIDEPGYIGQVFFATNPKKAEEDMKNHLLGRK